VDFYVDISLRKSILPPSSERILLVFCSHADHDHGPSCLRFVPLLRRAPSVFTCVVLEGRCSQAGRDRLVVFLQSVACRQCVYTLPWGRVLCSPSHSGYRQLPLTERVSLSSLNFIYFGKEVANFSPSVSAYLTRNAVWGCVRVLEVADRQ
jgi:hypothetical protein